MTSMMEDKKNDVKKRVKFKCWNKDCQRVFSLYIEKISAPTIYTECPFCGVECVAEMAIYRKNTVEIMRHPDGTEHSINGATWEFPEVIPTTQPDK